MCLKTLEQLQDGQLLKIDSPVNPTQDGLKVPEQEKLNFWRRDTFMPDWGMKDNLEKDYTYLKRVIWSHKTKL